ncbi:MAG: hypothetical protein GXX85_03365 [Ignavibacteria bacterium]|nr:hypothetical protein [Ignavibacteria bacterium]
MKLRFLICLIFAMPVLAQNEYPDSLNAQNPDSSSHSFIEKVYSITGEIGTYGEIYGAKGIQKRRPSGTGRLFFRPTLALFNTFSVDFDFLLSTEGSSARQSMNQFAVHPDWEWGKAHLGDFSMKFSDYTLDGISIRGGGVEINPGIFRFSALYGRTQRAVEGNAVTASYDREIWGTKIGVGRENGNFFDFNIIRSKDIGSSLDLARQDSSFFTDTTDVIDSLYATTYNDKFVISPQENLVAGFNTDLTLFEGMINFKGEFNGCLYTNDMRASEINDSTNFKSKIPGSINSIYKLKLSTSADYAVKTQLSANFKTINIKGGFTRIGASYTSLGLASQINDRIGYDIGVSTRLFENKLSVSTGFNKYSDNLENQKKHTTSRSAFSSNINYRITNEINLAASYAGNFLWNDAGNDTMKIDNSISSYMTSVSYYFLTGKISNTVSLTGIFQNTDDGNILRKNYNSKSNTFMVNYSAALSASLMLSPFASYTFTKITGQITKLTSLGLSINYNVLDWRLNNSLTVSNTNSGNSKNMNVQLQSGYPVWKNDMINLVIRYSGNKNLRYGKYTETLASLAYTHRF